MAVVRGARWPDQCGKKRRNTGAGASKMTRAHPQCPRRVPLASPRRCGRWPIRVAARLVGLPGRSKKRGSYALPLWSAI